MKNQNSKPESDFYHNLPLDDEHCHILIDFDEKVVTFHRLKETIEMTGAAILEIITLREDPEGNKSILIRLETQDVRNVVLTVSKFPLNRIQGYNSKKNFG